MRMRSRTAADPTADVAPGTAGQLKLYDTPPKTAAMIMAIVANQMDKYKAKKNLWRIPERTLMGFAAIGGSLGALAGMYLVRHKTKHLKFTVGIPVILFLHVLIAVWLIVK